MKELTDSKSFIRKFFSTEMIGIGIGMPIAAAYAILLTSIPPESIPATLQTVAITTAFIVIVVGMPLNLILSQKIKEYLKKAAKERLEAVEYHDLFLKLQGLPFKHGMALFLRIGAGAIICSNIMAFIIHIDFLQSIMAQLLAWYGAYIAGLIAYNAVLKLTKPELEKLLAAKLVAPAVLKKKKFFGLSYIAKTMSFIVVPVLFTNMTLIFTLISTVSAGADFNTIMIKFGIVMLINCLTIIALVLINSLEIRKNLHAQEESLQLFASQSGNLAQKIPTDLINEFSYQRFLMGMAIESLRQTILKMKKASSLMLDSVTNVSTSAAEISATANEQAAAIEEIVATMEESNQISNEAKQKATEVSRLSNHTMEEVVSGTATIEANQKQMEEIRENHGTTIQSMKELEDQIKSIWEIVNIINTIADQTKIIAFNAELEASAAGEAGKNFEIVAGEIRRLADNTMSSTKQIKTKINEIQKSSSQLIKITQNGSDTIEEGWEGTKQVKTTFDQIKISAESSNQASTSIVDLINNQASSSEQILLTLRQISAGVNNFVNTTKLISDSTGELQIMSTEMEELVSRFQLEANQKKAEKKQRQLNQEIHEETNR